METIKTLIRVASILVGILIYAFIWYCYIKDKEIRQTAYCYWCFERILNGFYFVWEIIHTMIIVFGLFLAWR